MGPRQHLHGTRRQRQLALHLPRAKPNYLTAEEWHAAVLWADRRLTLEAIAARTGCTRTAVQSMLRRVEEKLRAAARSPAYAQLPPRLWRRLAHAGLGSPAAVAALPDDALASIARLGPAGVAAIRAVIPLVEQARSDTSGRTLPSRTR